MAVLLGCQTLNLDPPEHASWLDWVVRGSFSQGLNLEEDSVMTDVLSGLPAC